MRPPLYPLFFPHPSLSLISLASTSSLFVSVLFPPACAHHARLHSPFSLGFCPSPTCACCSALNAKVSPTDVEEGMRVGVDRTKYSVQIPLPPKIDPTVRKQERERESQKWRGKRQNTPTSRRSCSPPAARSHSCKCLSRYRRPRASRRCAAHF